MNASHKKKVFIKKDKSHDKRKLGHESSKSDNTIKKQKIKIDNSPLPTVDHGPHLAHCILTKESLQRAPVLKEENFLESFCWPLKISEFMETVWNKKAFAVTSEASTRRIKNIVEEFMFGLDIRTLMANTASENIHVWMREKADDGSYSGQLNSFETDDNEAAMICYNAGGSLYFRSSQEMADIFVREVSQALGMDFSAYFPSEGPKAGSLRGEIETFISRKGHVTSWHFDYMQNFTIQLKGSKTWRLCSSGIKDPLRGNTPHYKNIDTVDQQLKCHRLQNPNFQFAPSSFDDQVSVTLHEGSVFYHPAGIWHQVECEEDSISINISLFSSSWADVIASGIHQLLWSKDDTRQSVIVKDPSSARSQLRELLDKTKKWLDEIQPEDLLPDSAFMPRLTIVDWKTVQWKTPELNQKVVLRKNPLAVLVELPYSEPVVNDDSDDEEETPVPSADQTRYVMHISFGNETLESAIRVEWFLPKEFKNVIQFIAKSSKFTVEEATNSDSRVLASDVNKLIKLMAGNGYIHIVK